MKICNSCGETKPLESYHKRAGVPDGRRGTCKACKRPWAAERARQRRRMKGGKAVMRKVTARVLESMPWLNRARHMVASARRRDLVPSPSAVKCLHHGADCSARVVWHHDSYLAEDLLTLTALCEFHHRQWHDTNTPTLPRTLDEWSDIMRRRNRWRNWMPKIALRHK